MDYVIGTNGTAVSPVDYIATNGTLTFGPGVINLAFAVPIIDDGLLEFNETVPITLENFVKASPGQYTSATIIVDDESLNVPCWHG